MQQFETFQAQIKMRRGAGFEVRAEVEGWDGKTVEARAAWEIEDRPQYAGEWACTVEDFPCAWVASGDLIRLA